MAWYAELKRRCWYCINKFDAIGWYKLECGYDSKIVDQSKSGKKYMESLRVLFGMTALVANQCIYKERK